MKLTKKQDIKRIENLLTQALINDGEMEIQLYEYEFAGAEDDFKQSLIEDNDDCIFSVTEKQNDIAMLLIEKSGEVYINEQARDRLKELWQHSYLKNMKQLIPAFATQLNANQLPINGVKVVGGLPPKNTITKAF